MIFKRSWHHVWRYACSRPAADAVCGAVYVKRTACVVPQVSGDLDPMRVDAKAVGVLLKRGLLSRFQTVAKSYFQSSMIANGLKLVLPFFFVGGEEH